MSFFRPFLPNRVPLPLRGKSESWIIRERIFQTILLVGLGVSTITTSTALLSGVTVANSGLFIFSVIYQASSIILALTRRQSYVLRSGLFMVLVYALGLYSLTANGLSGIGLLVLLALIALSATLAGPKTSFAFFVISLFTVFLAAASHTGSSDLLQIATRYYDSKITADWLSIGAFFTVMSMMIVVSLGMLLGNMQRAMDSRIKMADQVEAERAGLEQRVKERTSELERRLVQIRAAAEISRVISSILDSQTLFQQVAEITQQRTGLYYVGIFIVDEAGHYAVLRAGSGDAGQRMVAEGHRLQVGGNSMIGWATANRQARIALDVGVEAVRFNNPHLPETHSEVAIPIVGRYKTLGALSIQSKESNAFDEGDIVILQGIADSLAIAIENTRLFQQSQLDLEEIRSLNRQYLEQAWSDVLVSTGQMQYSYENPSLAARSGAVHPHQFPILLRDQPIGELTLETSLENLSPEDREMVETILAQTALTLESARLLAETQRKAAQEEKINEFTTLFTRALNIEEILKTAVQEIGQLPAVAEASVYLAPSGMDLISTQNPPKHNGHNQEANQ